jgi:hypothetical protein
MSDVPTQIVCFNVDRITMRIIDRTLSSDEIKNSRIRLGIEMLRDYDPIKHEFVIIRKDKEIEGV